MECVGGDTRTSSTWDTFREIVVTREGEYVVLQPAPSKAPDAVGKADGLEGVGVEL